MEGQTKIPKRLYKYRAFDARTVDLLVSDRVYFADPSSFNDPLDTKPCIKPDLPVAALEQALLCLVKRRVAAEMTAAAKATGYRGPKTTDHIERHSMRQAEHLIADIAYHATNPEFIAAPPGPHAELLAYHLQIELLQQHDGGILSLAERYACPLMWSHYGDQHHGLCIGYAVPEDVRQNLHKVRYGGNRRIEASKVAAMLNGNNEASNEVNEAVLLRKARDWRYEKEWRLIGQRGPADSSLELTDVTFGIRCMDSVKHAVIKALEGRDKPIRLYEMREVHGTFTIKRFPVNQQELAVYYPNRTLSVSEDFEALA